MNKPNLFYIKLFKDHLHQGARKRAVVLVTTHDPRIMPKYYKQRGYNFLPAQRSRV